MSIMSRFTVTPLLYACGGLLLVVLAMGVRLHLVGADRDTATAQRDTALARRDAVITERDAWKGRVTELAAANTSYGNALGGLQAQLTACQGENLRVSAQGQRAVAAARADAADADRTLQQFTAKFQTESRKPTCARALDAMAAACPTLEGY